MHILSFEVLLPQLYVYIYDVALQLLSALSDSAVSVHASRQVVAPTAFALTRCNWREACNSRGAGVKLLYIQSRSVADSVMLNCSDGKPMYWNRTLSFHIIRYKHQRDSPKKEMCRGGLARSSMLKEMGRNHETRPFSSFKIHSSQKSHISRDWRLPPQT
jgi:hypothetical protein